MLGRLAIHYYRPDFTEGQAKLLIQDYLSDLCNYKPEAIRDAISEYRQDPKSKYFPTVGQLVSILKAKQAEAAKWARYDNDIRPEFGDSRPHFWWAQDRRLWKPHWRESEIPSEWREAHDRRKARAA